MAIFVMVAGLMIAAASPILQTYTNNKHKISTGDNLAQAQTALNNYFQANRRFPCPAPRTAAMDSVSYGLEDTVHPCSALQDGSLVQQDLLDGTLRVNGVNNVVMGTTTAPVTTPVRIGALPVRTLGLPDGSDMDGFGNRFVYAVTENYATNSAPTTFGLGAITIHDDMGNNATAFPGNAVYALNAFGQDSRGAFNVNGIRLQLCNTTVTVGPNCNDSPPGPVTFVNTVHKSYNMGAQTVSNKLVYLADCGGIGTASIFGTTCPGEAHIYAYNLNGPLAPSHTDPRGPGLVGAPFFVGDVSLMTMADRIITVPPAPPSEFYTRFVNIPPMSFTSGMPFDATLQSWFGTCYDGTFVAPVAGNYTFITGADDGIAMWIDHTANRNVPNGGELANLTPAITLQNEFSGMLSAQNGGSFSIGVEPIGGLVGTSDTVVPESGYVMDTMGVNVTPLNPSFTTQAVPPLSNPAPTNPFQGNFWFAQSNPVPLSRGPHEVMVKYWQGWASAMGGMIFAYGPLNPIPVPAYNAYVPSATPPYLPTGNNVLQLGAPIGGDQISSYSCPH